MDFDKRYCQNRVRKRKKILQTSLPENKDTSVEDERQFKISRFVKDVTKFMEDKRGLSDQGGLPIDIGSQPKKTTKRTKPANLIARRGLFQNGIQTKFYSRGVFGKEMTARLDEDLQQIISLANKENVQNSNYHKRQADESVINELSKPAGPSQPPSRASSHRSSYQPSPVSHCVRNNYGGVFTENDKSPSLLDQLDNKLYPEFTRIVTLSCIDSKSIQFKNKSYVTAVKRKILEMYQKERKESSEEQRCLSDIQKSSVATSPLQSCSSLSEPQRCLSNPHTQGTTDSEQGFDFINFKPELLKSTTQFLEETIGAGSTMETSPDVPAFLKQISSPIPAQESQEEVLQRRLQYYDPLSRAPPVTSNLLPSQEEVLQRRLEYYEPLARDPSVTSSVLLSQEEVLQRSQQQGFLESYEEISRHPFSRHTIPNRDEELPRTLEHCEPLPRASLVPPAYNLMMPFDGGGDGPYNDSISHLFARPQEESPVFQYFPRRMF